KLKYPFDFKKNITTGYSKETKTLVIDYLLPKDNIVPNVQKYEYIQKGDKIKAKLRKEKDIRSIYNEVVFSIVIRTINEVFKFDKPNNIDNVVFNGYIEDIDLATGQDIKPYIISATIDKEKFKNIDITKINKLKCL
ncbi:restriction endonuclease, partial [Clostridium tertium]